MRKTLLVLTLSFAAVLNAGAQSASEIAAARSMAQQYGYSAAEFDNFVNRRNGGVVANSATNSATTVAASPITVVDNTTVEIKPAAPVHVANEGTIAEIYGHSFFASKGYGMIPSYNAPIPESYVLGPGDEVVIDIYGATNSSIVAVIGKDGKINIPELGPVSLAGFSVAKAEATMRGRLSQIYGGLNNGETRLQLSVGKIKGVTVNVIGEVNTPGIYNLPSMATIASAIFMAGGITGHGSVRSINLYRAGKHVGTFDLYKFIFGGAYNDNLRLRENDIISVAPYGNVVEIEGSVLRPMRYEMAPGETLEKLIEYAGGFRTFALRDLIHVARQNSAMGTTYDVKGKDIATFALLRGDRVSVARAVERYDNAVTVSGPVMYEGSYAISPQMKTVSQLIASAGGVREGVYVEKAYIRRLDEDRQPVVLTVNLSKVLDGSEDVALVREDRLYILSESEMRRTFNVSITGEVSKSGTYDYGEGMTLGDLLLMAGGFDPAAVKDKVEISRRGSFDYGEILTVDANDPETLKLKLAPYDRVMVHRDVYAREQSVVSVRGEILYPGTYSIENAEVRASDVILRAGGPTKDAFVKGARLIRNLTADEYARLQAAMKIARQQLTAASKDTVALATMYVGQEYTVAFNLEEALQNRGSYYDVVLRAGDRIEIPANNQSVKISGAVAYPNVIAFNPDFKYKDYVNLSGGFIKGARRGKAFAVYMNGDAAKLSSRHFRYEPGMEIIVPQKEQAVTRSITPSEVASIASSSSSVAAMVVSLINMLTRK